MKRGPAAVRFAEGCRFEPLWLNQIIDSLHWAAFTRRTLPSPLRDVNLGEGEVRGDVALRAKQLIDAGIELTGFRIH